MGLTYKRTQKINFLPKFIPKKILVIAPSWIGDIIIAQALFKYLKNQKHETNIDILAPHWSHGLLNMMPEINEIIDMPLGHSQLQLKQRWKIGKSLRDKDYQQAIVLTNSWKSAIIPFAARIPLRTGWLGEMRFGLLNDWKSLNKKKLPLMIQRFLALGSTPVINKAILWKSYQPNLNVNSKQVRKTLKNFSLELKKLLLILCPGAAYGPAKRWPIAYFAEIAKQKQAEGWDICLLGSKKDQSLAQSIQELTNNICIDLIGKTSLTQAIDILSLATVVISNDSGLMHCAAALNRPLIALYGSSSPEFTPPLTDTKRILSLNLSCSPCFQRECPLVHFNCLKKLKPKRVLKAINELF
ncbi:MAG: lipopolysaccharide heptosyltransferase II [Rickettsiella sp.]|nr:lipopolysaccharide heptosyltransferase II [Rickettsiella sp.]